MRAKTKSTFLFFAGGELMSVIALVCGFGLTNWQYYAITSLPLVILLVGRQLARTEVIEEAERMITMATELERKQ